MRWSVFAAFQLVAYLGFAQALPQAWWVQFRDKPPCVFQPEEYFCASALQRRKNQGLPTYDWYDMPVDAGYLGQISEHVQRLGNVSRWLNGAVVFAGPEVRALEGYPFVDTVLALGTRELAVAGKPEGLSPADSALLYWQTARMQAEEFWNRNFTGAGVRVAVFDVGFRGVDEAPEFAHIRERGGIVATWDFHRDQPVSFKKMSHGTAVLSCIAGEHQGRWMGLAHDADFLLARTEKLLGEPKAEELNWVAALEWADRNGAQVINSSLGYTQRRYFPEEMDGATALISRASRLAARKGLVVVNAAGNEGLDAWKFLSAPGDGDSSLTVGGINPYTDIHAGFSSYGPTADGRIKPDVVAYGRAVARFSSTLGPADGTSFASPLVAGFVACMLQENPRLTATQAMDTLRKSASLYPYYDYAHGFGVPQAGRYFRNELGYTPAQTFELFVNSSKAYLELADTPTTEKPVYIYYHLAQPNGRLLEYKVLQADASSTTQFLFEQNPYATSGTILRVYYLGKVAEYVYP